MQLVRLWLVLATIFACSSEALAFKPKVNLEHVFRHADLDNDGRLSFNECYERLLIFYVHLNRQAEIDPPRAEKIQGIYRTLGWNSRRKKLNYDEFVILTQIVLARTTTRFFVYRVVELLCAPVLAIALVNAACQHMGTLYVPSYIPFREQMGAKVFWISVLTAITSKQLPRLFILAVNHWLDRAQPFARTFRPQRRKRSA